MKEVQRVLALKRKRGRLENPRNSWCYLRKKKVEQPSAIRTQVKTKVESFFSQVPVSTSVHGSLGPSGHTRSKQKRLGDPVEREREKGKASFLLSFCSLLLSFLFF